MLPIYGDGTANTALTYHHGKLLVLGEADKPYVIRVLEDGELQTMGMMDFNKRLSHSFTAHPKVDPLTGKMFTFGYSQTPPYITYRVILEEGVMQDPVPITVSEAIMMQRFRHHRKLCNFFGSTDVLQAKGDGKGQQVYC